MIRIVAPVRDEGQDPVEIGDDLKQRPGGSLGAEREALECRVVVLSGTASATEWDADNTPVIVTCRSVG